MRVACSQAACPGSIELVVQAGARRGEGRRHQDKSALARNGRDVETTLVLATGSFSLAEAGMGPSCCALQLWASRGSPTRAITQSPPSSSCP